MTGWLLRYEGLGPGARAAARGAVRARQRPVRHPRRRARGAAPAAATTPAPTPPGCSTGSPTTSTATGSRTRASSTCPTGSRSPSASSDGDWLDLSAVHGHRLRAGAGPAPRGAHPPLPGRGRRRAGGPGSRQRRLVSMADPFLAALDCTLRRGELVRPAHRALRPRRAGRQLRRRPLPRARRRGTSSDGERRRRRRRHSSPCADDQPVADPGRRWPPGTGCWSTASRADVEPPPVVDGPASSPST